MDEDKNKKMVDLHQDLFWYAQNPDYIKGDLQTSWEMVRENTILSFNSLNDWFKPEDNKLIENNFESLPDGFVFVQSIDGISRDDGLQPVIAHIEGLSSFNGSKEDWDMLERWYDKGLRSIGIVWNKTNSLGGGTEDESIDSGLTKLGKKVIEWCLQKDVLVDMAHMNNKTFADVAKLVQEAKKPMFISHGNAYEICKNYRNYTDEQLRLVAESGGVIGVFFANTFIKEDRSNDVSIDDLIKHINHMRDVMSIDNIAIGSDFGGIISGTPNNLNAVTDLKVLEVVLIRSGYTKGDVEKIFYKNALRVIKSYL